MKQMFVVPELHITQNPGEKEIQVSARLLHMRDTGQEELTLSLRLPAGDRTLVELERQLFQRARLILEISLEQRNLPKPDQTKIEALAQELE